MTASNIWKEPIVDDFTIRHSRDLAWQMPRFHYHDVYEIYLALSDQAQYFINNQVYAIHQGDVFVFNNRDLHRTVAGAGQAYERYILVFQPAFAAGLSTAATDLLACFQNRPAGFTPCLHPTPAEWSAMVDWFEEGIRLSEDTSYGADVRRRLCLGQILLLINSLAQPARQPRTASLPVSSRSYQRISPLLRHIQQNLAGDLSLDTLSGAFFLSKHHLNVLFRQATGFAINDYIISCRLGRARELLGQDLTVAQVAEAVGYTSVAHFIRIFKARFGLPPGQYASRLAASPAVPGRAQSDGDLAAEVHL